MKSNLAAFATNTQASQPCYTYPVKLELDTNNTYLVTFPDVPEAVSVGDDADEALVNALDALESAIEIYFDEKREMPPPSKPKKGQPVVTLPALVVSKGSARERDGSPGCAQGGTRAPAEDVHMPQVDRLLDPRRFIGWTRWKRRSANSASRAGRVGFLDPSGQAGTGANKPRVKKNRGFSSASARQHKEENGRWRHRQPPTG